jgi:hypothetical protein
MGTKDGIRFCDACGRTVGTGEKLILSGGAWVCRDCAVPVVSPIRGVPASSRTRSPNMLHTARDQTRMSGPLWIATGITIAAVIGTATVLLWAALKAPKVQTPPSQPTPPVAVRPMASENQKKALATLKRLQSKVEVGMNFRDYSSALADTWADIKPLLEANDASASQRLAACLSEAIGYYKTAGDAWNRIVVPQDDDLRAREQGYKLRRDQLLRKQENECVRLFSWQMADACIKRAEAVLAGDRTGERQELTNITRIKADLKTELDSLATGEENNRREDAATEALIEKLCN